MEKIDLNDLDEPIRNLVQEYSTELKVSPTAIVNNLLTRVFAEKTAYEMESEGDPWEEQAEELCRLPDGTLFSGENLFAILVHERINELRDMGFRSKMQEMHKWDATALNPDPAENAKEKADRAELGGNDTTGK